VPARDGLVTINPARSTRAEPQATDAHAPKPRSLVAPNPNARPAIYGG